MTAITIFTDGASSGNPGPGGWGAVISTEELVKELGGANKNTTNNRMELTAAIESLRYIKTSGLSGEITLYTDSSYVLNGITTWVFAWQKRDWQTKDKKPVSNKDLWEELLSVTQVLNVSWKLLPGHATVVGNERADTIATGFAQGELPTLFSGKKKDYTIKIDEIPDEEEVNKLKKKQAYSYLSLVNDKAMRHKTWASCKERVNGVESPRFRKALSPEHEENILSEWGINPSDVSIAE